MSNISRLNPKGQHSAASLLKTTLCAFVAAVAILVTAVLPAEFGLDPTGLGRVMGLDSLRLESSPTPDSALTQTADTALNTAFTLWKASSTPRSDTIKVPLMPGQGAEIKSVMTPGDRFMFSWHVEGGIVSFDMHGERPDSGGAFTSYWVGANQREASGSFTAPFAGSHGWYWENTGTEPVIVILQTYGFYGDLYMP
ncbi:hypothetical protein GCM10011352_17380 [Marinobacterium zhoushanense]|uniref:Transmembrane anchor protein n=1 Tax=Marinobacterium zhoushanense TaxID=1679163 RepID=A0ABQ1K8W2_9GAMM|nr:hypothetical protein [Marinobacterium zhoushanense]GGB91848.1 hypothetical protein GCM10011352_17380 [Marinobacterium zhoushanense]